MRRVLFGLGRHLLPVPWALFAAGVRRAARTTQRALGELTPEQRRVHHFVVRELPRLGRPMAPADVAGALGIPAARVGEILDELERRLIFLFRPDGRDVAWAYPVTVEPTPHTLAFSSGERLWAA
jgi:alkylated DNA nucleotide flippase Atl1